MDWWGLLHFFLVFCFGTRKNKVLSPEILDRWSINSEIRLGLTRKYTLWDYFLGTIAHTIRYLGTGLGIGFTITLLCFANISMEAQTDLSVALVISIWKFSGKLDRKKKGFSQLKHSIGLVYLFIYLFAATYTFLSSKWQILKPVVHNFFVKRSKTNYHNKILVMLMFSYWPWKILEGVSKKVYNHFSSYCKNDGELFFLLSTIYSI